jgi:hypothetical protein
MSSDPTRQQQGLATTTATAGSGGLGHSTPLVTIPSPGSIITHGISVPAGDNHPLAAMEKPVVVMTAGGAGIAAVARPPTRSSAPTPIPPAVPQAVPPVRSLSNTPSTTTTTTTGNHPMAQVVPTPVSPTKSLEALADQFLAESSYRTEHFGLPPLLRPISLPQEEPIQRLRTLVDRRAWGDVLKVSTTLLTDTNDPHAAVYASLVEWPATTTTATSMDSSGSDVPPTHQQDVAAENASFTPELQQETVEILALKCHAWLKLRRYQDLSAEVERWNFVQDNDATAESPAWIPWSLRKFCLWCLCRHRRRRWKCRLCDCLAP